MPGPCMLVGCPGSGKSKVALRLALQEVNRTGYPLVIVDPARAWNFKQFPHAETRRELADLVWRDGKIAAYTPETPEDFIELMKGVRGGRRVILLVDELADCIPNAGKIPHAILILIRWWRHLDIAAIIATTQCYRDVGSKLKNNVTRWKIFRIPPGPDQDDLCRDFRIKPEQLEALQEEEFIEVTTGFQK